MPRSPMQDRAHRHNSLLGSNAMMISHIRNVIASDTTTDEAKKIAGRIYADAHILGSALRTRKD